MTIDQLKNKVASLEADLHNRVRSTEERCNHRTQILTDKVKKLDRRIAKLERQLTSRDVANSDGNGHRKQYDEK